MLGLHETAQTLLILSVDVGIVLDLDSVVAKHLQPFSVGQNDSLVGEGEVLTGELSADLVDLRTVSFLEAVEDEAKHAVEQLEYFVIVLLECHL